MKQEIIKQWSVSGKTTLLRGLEGSFWEDHLTSVDQLRLHFRERLKLQVRFGIKSWFAVWGLAQMTLLGMTLFWAFFFFFLFVFNDSNPDKLPNIVSKNCVSGKMVQYNPLLAWGCGLNNISSRATQQPLLFWETKSSYPCLCLSTRGEVVLSFKHWPVWLQMRCSVSERQGPDCPP